MLMPNFIESNSMATTNNTSIMAATFAFYKKKIKKIVVIMQFWGVFTQNTLEKRLFIWTKHKNPNTGKRKDSPFCNAAVEWRRQKCHQFFILSSRAKTTKFSCCLCEDAQGQRPAISRYVGGHLPLHRSTLTQWM